MYASAPTALDGPQSASCVAQDISLEQAINKLKSSLSKILDNPGDVSLPKGVTVRDGNISINLNQFAPISPPRNETPNGKFLYQMSNGNVVMTNDGNVAPTAFFRQNLDGFVELINDEVTINVTKLLNAIATNNYQVLNALAYISKSQIHLPDQAEIKSAAKLLCCRESTSLCAMQLWALFANRFRSRAK
jgi:hypothetical protein